MRAAVERYQRTPRLLLVVLGIGLSVVLARVFTPPHPPGTVMQGPQGASAQHPFTGMPIGLRMPFTWQLVMTVVTGAMSLAMLMYAIRVARKTSSVLPVLFWVAGLATVLLEPVVDTMANIVHSPGGAWTVFSVDGHPIPWHVLLCYPWYFGGLPILLFERMRRRVIGRGFWWDHYVLVGILVPLVEVVPAHYNVWIYYGAQPFKIGATPDGVAAANVCAVVLPALVIYMLLPRLTGWRQLITVALIPAIAMAAHAGAGVVLYVTLGQNTEHISQLWIQGAGLAAIGMSLMLVWVMLEIVYGLQPVGAGDPPACRGGLDLERSFAISYDS
jgi:hypothetical protein